MEKQVSYQGYFSISIEKITFSTEILTFEKLNCGFFFTRFTYEKTPQNSIENNYSLFRNKRFALNEMFQQNASKFAIFYV